MNRCLKCGKSLGTGDINGTCSECRGQTFCTTTQNEIITPEEAKNALLCLDNKVSEDFFTDEFDIILNYICQTEVIVDEHETLKNRNEPKKVVFNVKDTVYVGCADCPTCGATIDRDDESGLINFCQYCGQALDWGEAK